MSWLSNIVIFVQEIGSLIKFSTLPEGYGDSIQHHRYLILPDTVFFVISKKKT